MTQAYRTTAGFLKEFRPGTDSRVSDSPKVYTKGSSSSGRRNLLLIDCRYCSSVREEGNRKIHGDKMMQYKQKD